MQIYIHIPFCVKKCAYCDFLSFPQNQGKIDAYVEALVKEMHMYNVYKALSPNEQSGSVSTVFIGGGTPSILTPNQVKRIFDALNETFKIDEQAEITIEANPGTVTKEKLLAYRECGINRISFGLQSTNNDELRLLGRIHTYEQFLKNYELARMCGFNNINIDLISAIPKQTLSSWTTTLEKVINLKPEHISAYSLIVEEGTPFAKLYGEDCPKEMELPDEDTERAIYYETEELLSEAGYHRYEISNYAKEGKECRHNLGYWERKNYLGLGLGASSLVDNVRYKNIDDLNDYIEHAGELSKIQEEREVLSVTAQMEEFIFLGLRKMQGISEKEFQEIFGKDIEECYGIQIKKLMEEMLLDRKNGRLRLTKRGIDISNYVFAEFLS